MTNLETVLADEADVCLARAALWHALTLGFRPPDAETLRRLTAPCAVAELASAAQLLEERDGGADLEAGVLGLVREDAEVSALESRHRRHFGHTARGEVPPYETEYGNEALFQQPQELSDISAFLCAFGLAVRPDAHERVDHVSCECELLCFLCLKDAYACQHGDDEMAQATRHAYRLFLRDHLGRFAPAFAGRLACVDGGGWYSSVAELLRVVVEHESRRIGIPTGSEQLGLRPDPATCTAPMGCGLAGEGACGEAAETSPE